MVLDGKSAASALFKELSIKLTNINKSLAVIQVGENPASSAYISIKRKKAEELEIPFVHIQLDRTVQNQDVISEINRLNLDENIGGIILQLPLPVQLNKQLLLDTVSPKKDIDCLGSVNTGRFISGAGMIMPATVLGVMKLLAFYKIDIEGKDVCIIGASNLVGKPLGIALVNKEATVTLCHIKTRDIEKFTTTADIVVTAAGAPKFFTKKYFKNGQTVIDIGISKGEDGKLYGDVDYNAVSEIVENITPVPGGVGPMTVYGLFENFVTLNS